MNNTQNNINRRNVTSIVQRIRIANGPNKRGVWPGTVLSNDLRPSANIIQQYYEIFLNDFEQHPADKWRMKKITNINYAQQEKNIINALTQSIQRERRKKRNTRKPEANNLHYLRLPNIEQQRKALAVSLRRQGYTIKNTGLYTNTNGNHATARVERRKRRTPIQYIRREPRQIETGEKMYTPPKRAGAFY